MKHSIRTFASQVLLGAAYLLVATVAEAQVAESPRSPGWAADAMAARLHAAQGQLGPHAIDFTRYAKDTKDLPIGVFDSGIGGLTVYEALLRCDEFHNDTLQPGADGLPDFQGERFIYLADQANMPYGNYPEVGREDYLRELILKDAAFLLGNRYWSSPQAKRPTLDKPPVKAIVIACNTATAYGLDDIRAAIDRWQIRVPVVGVVEAGARSVVESLPALNAAGTVEPNTVAVLATLGMCRSRAYPKAIQRAAGQAGRRVPEVWQQGSVGLAGAIEGDPAFTRSSNSAGGNNPYQGPAVANARAPLDPALVAVYGLDMTQVLGDPKRPETWRLNSTENYVRYDVATLVEEYRKSGGTRLIEYVVLGCTHYPLEQDRIAAAFARLREYKDADGRQPYRHLIAEKVEYIDPARLTAKALFRELALSRLLLRDAPPREPVDDLLFISTPHTEAAGVQLTSDGRFEQAFQYARTAGRFDVEDCKIVPLRGPLLNASARAYLSRALPAAWKRLQAFEETFHVAE